MMEPRRTPVAAAGLGFALALGIGLFAGAARADIYRYTDDAGVVHFADRPIDRRFTIYQKDAVAPREATALQPKEQRYDTELNDACSLYSVDPAIAKAVMKAESDFEPLSRSHKGAMGLMQLMPGTAERLGVRDPWDPRENIHGGVKYLGNLLRQFGSVHLAVAAYNAGENAVERYGGIPPYEETQTYVKRVLRNLEGYRRVGFGGQVAAAVAAPQAPPVVTVTRADGVRVFTNVPWYYQANAR